MAILDIVILLCFIPAIVSGISKGFVKQVIDFVAILLAAWAAFRFSTMLSEWLGTYVTLDPTVLKVICFVLIAIVVALILNLIGVLITKALQKLSLGFFNRLLGLVFGVLKVGLIIGLVILLFETHRQHHLPHPEILHHGRDRRRRCGRGRYRGHLRECLGSCSSRLRPRSVRWPSPSTARSSPPAKATSPVRTQR